MTLDKVTEAVIAKKWWSEQVKLYPFFFTTIHNRQLSPQSIDEDIKATYVEAIDYITTGLVDGGRVWAFKSSRARIKFMDILKAAGMDLVDLVGEDHASIV